MKDRNSAIQAALNVEGLMTEEELRQMAELLPDVPYPRVLETGAWLGRSATLWHALGAQVFTIDDWTGKWATPHTAGQEDWLDKFLKGTNPEITPIQANTIVNHMELFTLVRLLFLVRKADLVFIDADHTYVGVHADLNLAKHAIGPGGVVCGHDIDFPGVKQAVEQEFGPEGYVALGPKLWRAVK